MKSKTPRRRKPSAAARVRRFWVLALLLALGVASAAVAIMLWPGFYPRNLVVSGNLHVSRGEILARAGIAPDVNMWLQDPHAMAERIESIPYVELAAIHRIPPSTVTITITERVPVAVVRSGALFALVDGELHVIRSVVGPQPELPVLIAGPNVALLPGSVLGDPDTVALRDAQKALDGAHVAIAALALDRFGEIVATLPGGIVLELGDEESMDRKLALVKPILAQAARSSRPVAAIDLRAPSTPVLVYKK
ncbi:MAG TPA: FtsQ-type POTRA domain-containing protein [Verrucomicrobiae bacterium]|nr:FtsQ-type POTRA domain-containing protein [Verrucomicrobiae bacterium]